MIVVNPLRELGLVRFRVPSDWRSLLFGSSVSDVYLQPHVGADVAVFKALLKGVVEAGGVDRGFVAAHTSGWDAVEADLAATSWRALVDASGVPRAEIDAAVAMLLGAQRGIAAWAMGLTHHAHGVDNVLALANLALARGWLGRPGAGLLPIRGHSNVQGVGSVGVTPQLKAAFAARMEEVYGIPTARTAGLDTYASMAAAAEGRMRAAVLLGGNLFASNPDRMWAAAALRRLALTVSITPKLNEGHVHGRGQTAVILPVLARDEESQCTTQESMFNFVRLSEGGEPAVDGDLRSEVEVIAALAELILPPGRFDWSAFRSHERLRQEMARIVPGYAPIGDIDRTRREFHVTGRVLHEPPFLTDDGKAHFHVTPIPAFAPPAGEFRLLRGTVQHRRLRGGGPLPREPPPRRRHDGGRGRRATRGPRGGSGRRRDRRRPAPRDGGHRGAAARKPRDVLPRGQCAGAAAARRPLEDARVQVRGGAAPAGERRRGRPACLTARDPRAASGGGRSWRSGGASRGRRAIG